MEQNRLLAPSAAVGESTRLLKATDDSRLSGLTVAVDSNRLSSPTFAGDAS